MVEAAAQPPPAAEQKAASQGAGQAGAQPRVAKASATALLRGGEEAGSGRLPSTSSELSVGSGAGVGNGNGRALGHTPQSLPPEILGLYNRTEPGRHSRHGSLSSLPEGERSMGSLQEGGSRHSNGRRESRDLQPPPAEADEPADPGKQPTPFESAQAQAYVAGEPQDRLVAEPVWGPATLDSCPVIMVPKNYQAKEGAKLTDDLVVGKHISSGLQGGVYDLKNLDGSKANMVFKLVHPHAPLAEVEREWEVGMRLNQLAEVDGSLPGFMGVGAGIRGGGKFRGMLLERLHGRTVDKVICTRDFHNVHYVYAMLFSIFTALDRAQGALGFHHADLRLANVMEIMPTQEEEAAAAEDPLVGGPQEGGTDLGERQRHVRFQFKIIDYGLAIFDETFAAGPDVVLEEEVDSAASRRSINLQRQASIPPATGCVAAFPFPVLRKDRLTSDMPPTSPLERVYRFMWRRKGDVYHLVFELGEWLDGRVWPSQDELDVLRLVDFVEHVTGVRMRYWFSDEMGEDGVGGWRDRACGPFERHDSAMHFLRRWHVRLRSWISPSNPGLTAAEALTAPFFTKRISLRGVIHGCSSRYSRWTKAKKRRPSGARPRPRVAL